jgi:mono/diheme cytochrome c family protein
MLKLLGPAGVQILLCTLLAALLGGCPQRVPQYPSTASLPPGDAAQEPAASGGAAAPDDAANGGGKGAARGEPTIPQPGPDPTEEELAEPPPAKTGDELYVAGNCHVCHGADRNGSSLGPPLRKLAANWSAEEMVKYFKDPGNYAASDPRLSEHKGKYQMVMPPLRIPDADQLRLAQWLLEQN